MNEAINLPAHTEAEALEAEALALEALAAAKRAQAAAKKTAAPSTEWLGLTELRAFGFTRESLASAAEKGLPVHKGARGRIQVRRIDVDAWIASRPWKPAPRKATDVPVDLDEWERQAEAELRLVAGGKK